MENSDLKMDLINRYSIKQLKEDEVFSFKIVLCDNEVDRDGERFSVDSLYKLQEMFVGKTGIFDHNPKSEGQTARIYDTSVETADHQTTVGEVYHALTAYAYMVRCDKNKDLIREIEAGIKKEVSVGCSVNRVVCCVCGANVKQELCRHKKGEVYDGKVCHHILEEPTDAYEWSFVAVPAQTKAGVTKKFLIENGGNTMDFIKSLGSEEVVLSKSQSAQLKDYICGLEKKAEFAEKYKAELVSEVVKFGYLAYPDMPSEVLMSVGKKMDIDELYLLKNTFMKNTPLAPTCSVEAKSDISKGNDEFFI